MRKKSEKVEMDNTIRISARKDITRYFEAMLLRGQPYPYEKYKCIKISFTGNLKNDVHYLTKLFWHYGLVPTEITRLKKGLKIDKGVILDKVYELTLVKIPALRGLDDDDFDKWWKDKTFKVFMEEN